MIETTSKTDQIGVRCVDLLLICIDQLFSSSSTLLISWQRRSGVAPRTGPVLADGPIRTARRGPTRAHCPARDRPRETSGPSAHSKGQPPTAAPRGRPRRTTMQIFVNDLDGRTRTLDVDHETTAADVCGEAAGSSTTVAS